MRPASLPNHQQIPHFKNRKNHEFEEGGGGKGVEERLNYDASR